MAPDDIDQDKLAAEWAAALDEQEDDKPASQSDIDALFDQPAGDVAADVTGGGSGGAEDWPAGMSRPEKAGGFSTTSATWIAKTFCVESPPWSMDWTRML